MSLLHQDSPDEIDDAARGEEFTKGTSHVVWATLAAALLVTAALAAYFIAGEKPPVASGEILQVWAHPLHTVTSGVDANGAPMAQESYDQMMVFARVRLHNQSQQPVFLGAALCNATLSDGIHSSYVASAAEYSRIFSAFPELAPLRGAPLKLETNLAAGQSVEGDIVATFRISKAQWEARKKLDFSFGLRYQPELKLTPATPVIEQ
jgi:hypothetical protein